jgi:hypothetical protein
MLKLNSRCSHLGVSRIEILVMHVQSEWGSHGTSVTTRVNFHDSLSFRLSFVFLPLTVTKQYLKFLYNHTDALHCAKPEETERQSMAGLLCIMKL